MATKCYAMLRGSAIRVTALDEAGRVPDTIRFAVSTCVAKVTVNEVTEPGKNETLRTPDEKRRLKISGSAISIRRLCDIDFLRVDPGVLSIVSGTDEVAQSLAASGFGSAPFGEAPFGSGYGDTEQDVRGFDVTTSERRASFALEVWTKLAGTRCEDGSPAWGYTLFPHLRGGVVSGPVFANALVSFNLTKAQTRRSTGWEVGPHDLTGPFERLLTPVSRNTTFRSFITSAAPPAQANGVQTKVDILSNGTASNPMPYPDAPAIISGGSAADAGPYIISGGRA